MFLSDGLPVGKLYFRRERCASRKGERLTYFWRICLYPGHVHDKDALLGQYLRQLLPYRVLGSEAHDLCFAIDSYDAIEWHLAGPKPVHLGRFLELFERFVAVFLERRRRDFCLDFYFPRFFVACRLNVFCEHEGDYTCFTHFHQVSVTAWR